MRAAAVSEPPLSLVRAVDTHRLVPTRYEDSVLCALADSDEMLNDLFEIEGATNDRLLAQAGLLPGIGIDELVFRLRYYRIVNAAFTHPHPLGGRFNSPDRGAWYCAFELATSIDEVAYHHSLSLAEIDVRDDVVRYRDYLSDFSAELHDLRGSGATQRACLDPQSYIASQELASHLLDADAIGVIYPSVRSKQGTCVALFRPSVVSNVREGCIATLTWSGSLKPHVAVSSAP